MTRLACIGVLALGLAMAVPALGGMVLTADARLDGDVAFTDAGPRVGGKTVPWDAVLCVVPQGRVQTLIAPGAVRLAGGEVWRGDILGLSAGKLTVRLALFGRREMDVRQVVGIEFAATGGADAAVPGTLYREKGEPVPGTLMWIDEGRLAIDSPLGVLTLPREGAVRYVFPAAAKPAAAEGDEIGLIDGSVLRGKARPVVGGLQVEHPVLGAIKIDAGLVRYIARPSARMVDLATLAPAAVTAVGPLGPAAAGATVESHRGDAAVGGAAACLASVRVEPKTTIRYRLPPGGGKAVFTARLLPVEGARGDVRVRVLAGGQTLLEKELAAGAAPMDVRADVPGDGELAVEVDFGARMAFPCGVVLADPMIVR